MTEIPTEPDTIAGRLVAATIIIATVAIAASALVVWLLASRIAHGGGAGGVAPAGLEPPADPFALATEHERHRVEQQRALDSWQWADAEHTRVRMPIELAIDRYLAGAK